MTVKQGAGNRCAGLFEVGQSPDGDNPPAVLTGTGPQVDNRICRANGFLVMFDDQNAVAAIAQRFERINQDAVIAGMQADGRLIQDITNPGEIGSQLGGQTDSLGFSAGKRISAAGQRKVGQAQLIQQRQPGQYFGNNRLGDGLFLCTELQRSD